MRLIHLIPNSVYVLFSWQSLTYRAESNVFQGAFPAIRAACFAHRYCMVNRTNCGDVAIDRPQISHSDAVDRVIENDAGWNENSNVSGRRRRLPRQAKMLTRSRQSASSLSLSGSSITSMMSSAGLVLTEEVSASKATMSTATTGHAGERLCGDSSIGSIGASSTSKKTTESLSASVYDNLLPFRQAHRALIKVPRFSRRGAFLEEMRHRRPCILVAVMLCGRPCVVSTVNS